MSLKTEEFYTVKNKLNELVELRELINELTRHKTNKTKKESMKQLVHGLNQITCAIVSYNSDENEIKDVELFLLKLLESKEEIINEANKYNQKNDTEE